MAGSNSTTRNRITNPRGRRERGWSSASGFPSLGAARRQFGLERLRRVGKNSPALLLPALRMRPNVVTGVAPEVQEPLQNGSQAGLLARTGGACETTHDGMNVRGLSSAVHKGAPDRSASYRGREPVGALCEVNRRTIRLDCDTRIPPGRPASARPADVSGGRWSHGGGRHRRGPGGSGGRFRPGAVARCRYRQDTGTEEHQSVPGRVTGLCSTGSPNWAGTPKNAALTVPLPINAVVKTGASNVLGVA
jgi:hypothetical protein